MKYAVEYNAEIGNFCLAFESDEDAAVYTKIENDRMNLTPFNCVFVASSEGYPTGVVKAGTLKNCTTYDHMLAATEDTFAAIMDEVQSA